MEDEVADPAVPWVRRVSAVLVVAAWAVAAGDLSDERARLLTGIANATMCRLARGGGAACGRRMAGA